MYTAHVTMTRIYYIQRLTPMDMQLTTSWIIGNLSKSSEVNRMKNVAQDMYLISTPNQLKKNNSQRVSQNVIKDLFNPIGLTVTHG